MKRLLTPQVGRTIYAMETTLTGGRDYVLVSDADGYANTLVLTGKLTPLAVNEKIIWLPDEAKLSELKEVLNEYTKTNVWNPEDEPYEQYIANAYIYAAEAYTSELNNKGKEAQGEAEAPTEKQTTGGRKKATTEPAPEKHAATE